MTDLTTTSKKPTESQRQALLAHHEKAARAFEMYGQTENAEMARKAAEAMRMD